MEFALATADDIGTWEQIKTRFHTHLLQQQVVGTEERKQPAGATPIPKSVLLYLCGTEAIKKFSSLLRDNVDLSSWLEEFEDMCLPRFLVLCERLKFFSRMRKPDEPMCQFISDLCRLSEGCQFLEQNDRFLKERILNGVCTEKCGEIFISTEESDLKDVIDLCYSVSGCDKENCLQHVHSKTLTSFVCKQTEANHSGKMKGSEFVGKRSLSVRKRRKPALKLKMSKAVKTVINGKEKEVAEAIHFTRSTKRQMMKTAMGFDTSEKLEEKVASPQRVQGDGSNCSVAQTCKEEEKIICSVTGKEVNMNLHDDREDCFQAEDIKLEEASSDGFLLEDPSVAKEDGQSGDRKCEKDQPHMCVICGSKHKTAHVLKCHMRIHTGEKLYRCDLCDLSFMHSGSRSRHLRQVHRELLKFRCEDCGMLFELQTALDQHRLSHSKPEQVECEECGKRCPSTRELYLHRKSEHKNTRYACEFCEQAFPYPSKLKLHQMSKHNVTKPFMCEICGSSFAEQNMLSNHMNIHTKEKEHECAVCGRHFLLKTTLNNHLHTHLAQKPYTCEVCGVSFKLAYYLKSHMQTHQKHRERPHKCGTCGKTFLKSSQLRNHERKHTGEKPFKCQVCGAFFSQLSSMRKHVKVIHEGEKPQDKFACEYCGLSFSHSCKLKLHLMKHTGERPFVCKLCGCSYRENHQLTQHLKTHTGDEPYRCHICGRRFLQRSYLEGHIRNHTGEKPFVCSVCGASFSQKGYLRDHSKVHATNRERRYKCSVCGKAFTCSSHMRSHERLHSGEKPYKCNVCGYKFTKRSSVKKHLKRTHGVEEPLTDESNHVVSNEDLDVFSLTSE